MNDSYNNANENFANYHTEIVKDRLRSFCGFNISNGYNKINNDNDTDNNNNTNNNNNNYDDKNNWNQNYIFSHVV